jgi:tRNA modification GTPase
MPDPDTIVAVSTPPGRGGIGIVRLSGPRALEIASPLLRLRHELTPTRARFCEILDLSYESGCPMFDEVDRGNTWDDAVISTEGGALAAEAERSPHLSSLPSNLESRTSNPVLDHAIATFFPAPHSATGDDVLEIAAHGSPVLLDYLVRQCCARGARLAEPGEFTQRAFLSGRIDLTQAEAIHDLIASSTLEQARLAARQLSGSLALTVAPIKASLVALIATLEAGIDFAEDDIDVLPAPQITAQIAAIQAPLAALERSFSYGRILRSGFRLAIVGRPNAGKSSLFNRLVQRDRAIVTASPGTTRDLVTETVAIDGIPVELIDTAGLRDSTDEAERLGIAKSHQAIADADLVLLVLDAPSIAAANALAPEDLALLTRESPSPLLIALNKSDLLQNPLQIEHLIATFGCGPANLNPRTSNLAPCAWNLVETSALTGLGLPALRAAIVAAVAGPAAATRESATLTNLRQHQSVSESLRALAAAQAAVASRIPHEMLLLDLYAALRALDALTGATTTDDVLHLIFSTFCIGK